MYSACKPYTDTKEYLARPGVSESPLLLGILSDIEIFQQLSIRAEPKRRPIIRVADGISKNHCAQPAMKNAAHVMGK